MSAASEEFDLPEFLERFRQSLQDQNPSTESDLPQSLWKYGQLCEETNQRLRECFALVQRGQYSNAVALSEREPNLLERCTLLEIPERDVLATVAQVVGTKPPSLLNRDLVEALQEAYQKGETATENLRVLHRLTLARAPLPARLAIMRRLLIQDPNRRFLDTDIRTFERAWFKQALPFVQQFVKQGRPELIQEVMQDLQTGGYVETPPSSLISNLQAQFAKVQAALLPMLAEEIRQAFADRSRLHLMQLSERWRLLVAEAGLPDADTRFGVAEAWDWLSMTLDEERENREKTQARSRLSRLFQAHDTKRHDFEVAYQTAKSLHAVDAELEQQFRSWVAKTDRRRTMLLVGSASAAVLIVGFAILGVAVAMRSPEPANTGNRVGVAASPSNNGELVATAHEVAIKSDKSPPDERGNDGPEHGSTTRQSVVKVNEKSLSESDKWASLAAQLTAFQKEMEGVNGTNESLQRLAIFLADKVAPNAPDPEMARRANLAKVTLPTWIKALEVQRMMQSGDFLTHPINADDWKGQQPEGTLTAAAELSEMLRNRNASIKDSEFATVKERLARVDIVDLQVIRKRGDEARAYSKKPPALEKGILYVDELRNGDGREEKRIPFPGDAKVARAPQSIFAEQAANIWGSSGSNSPDNWDKRLAEIDDALLESTDMDPILKLDLVRRFLHLAVSTSAGYREQLQEHPGFKAVMGALARIDGNWLDPQNDETLTAQREQAKKLIANAPRLSPLAADAATRDDQRLTVLKRALIVLGWIGRDSDAHPVLAIFRGAKPAAGSRLYTVVGGNWIELGAVSADGKDNLVNETALKYVGWPVFALLLRDDRIH